MQNNNFLGTAKIGQLLRKFAIPCIASMLITALYNIVDQIFIGNSSLGYLGNAATSVVFPITIISYAFAWCFGDGAVALMSIRQGQKQTKGIDRIIGNSLAVTAIAAVIYMFLCFIFMEPILTIFGASEASMGLAKAYFTIVLAASWAPMLTGPLSNVIRADGSPAFAMVVTVSGAIINIILDPLFIYAFNMGIEGAAYATIIGQIISLLIALFYNFFRSKTYHLSLRSFTIEPQTIAAFTKLGISTFITQMSIVATSLVGNLMLAKWGAVSRYGIDIPIATMGIAIKVFTVVINIVVGLAVGAQPILGFNFGAEKYDRVKRTFRLVTIWTLALGIAATLIFELCPDVVISIFGTQDDLYMEFARLMFREFLALVTFTLFIKMVAIFFQSIGQSVKSAIVSLTRDIVCFIPLCLILPNFMGIDGVLLAAPVADVIGMVVATTLVVIFLRRLTPASAAPQMQGAESSLLAAATQGTESDLPAAAPDAAKPVIRESHPGPIITIARQHGSAGKAIGQLVAQQLGIPCYYKELTALIAEQSGMAEDYIKQISTRDTQSFMHELYLGSMPANYAIEAQREVITEIAKHGSAVIIGRAADWVLRDNPHVVRIFISAPEQYRVKKLKEMYGDKPKQALAALARSDRNRALFYKAVSGQDWGKRENYDLTLDSSIGNEATARIITEFVKARQAEKKA